MQCGTCCEPPDRNGNIFNSDSEDAGTGTARSSFANCSVSVCFQDPPMQPPLHRAAAGNNFPSETFTAELLEYQVEAL